MNAVKIVLKRYPHQMITTFLRVELIFTSLCLHLFFKLAYSKYIPPAETLITAKEIEPKCLLDLL
jgi:hypothetical protein